ncbi:MAG: DegT/DnrJ/EryC1/StrS family aminotransferase [Acidobacteria bacterium]|nr:DegT/DnrJ/EryC1/StrS family aminotransferase [Acidobacteriota bacterium]
MRLPYRGGGAGPVPDGAGPLLFRSAPLRQARPGPAMINVFGSFFGEEEAEEVRSSLKAQWAGIGPKTAAFERAMAERLGGDFVLLDSGSNSLYMAVKLLDLPAGSEVVVPSFTWIACAHAVVLSGCVPVFCDVDLDTHNATVETILRQITPRTRAVMVVHYAGLPVRMEEVLGLGLPVIEDAAHAVDSSLKGRPCGTLGEVGIFSFDAIKNLAMGQGGGLTARDPARVEGARKLRYCGIAKSGFEASANKDRWWEYEVSDFFPKMLPCDIAASIGLAQLRKLSSMQDRRHRIWETYQRELAGVGWLARPQNAAPGDRHSYFTYCIRVAGGRRDALAKHLYAGGIYTTLRYHPLHLIPIYRSMACLPVCERLNQEALNLPLHPGLSDTDVEKIIRAVREFRA